MNDSPTRVLVVDDEKSIQKFLRIWLENESYKVITAYTAQEGLKKVTEDHPDLVLLDIFLPDQSGFEVLSAVRAWSSLPIIILSVQGEEKEKIRFLDAGANDYVTKPFSPGELLARIRAALRQRMPAGEAAFKSGRLEIDFAHRLVMVEGKKIKLTRIEYNILSLLARHAGKVVTQTQIMREVWKPGMETETNLLRVYVANLRKKVEQRSDDPELIITEPAVGYRLMVI
ncbi:MAG: response regulator transcription factor [Spirochaetia bacterium]|nr:response regulator transcription factor [Spirochaetia bacterium]